MVILFGAVTLLGINFEARGMENKTLLIGAGVGTAVLATTVLLIKNTATYQTYNQHKARLVEEKEKSDNPLFDAQPLSITGLQLEENPVNDRIAAFQKEYDKQRNASAQQTTMFDVSWNQKVLFENYDPNKK